jgi:hypothetical protein
MNEAQMDKVEMLDHAMDMLEALGIEYDVAETFINSCYDDFYTKGWDDAIKKKVCNVYMASNYGKEAIYPSCINAELFASIAGTTTLTRDTIRKIKVLGYTVIQRHKELL